MKISLKLFVASVLLSGGAQNLRAQLIPGNGTGLSVDANTVAIFRFEDTASTALDTAGNSRNATVTNTTVGSGLFGSARVFNGTSDRLEFNDVFNALSGSSGWTIEYFAKVPTAGTQGPSMENANASAGWYLVPGDGSISYGIKTSSSGNSWEVLTSVTAPAMDTAWHYYALTWTSGGALSVYRDGVFLGSSLVSGSWGGSNIYGVYLDYSSYWSQYYGAGSIDDLRFSSVARSATEIANAYTLAAVPEPSTYAALAGGALFGFAVWRRRRRAA